MPSLDTVNYLVGLATLAMQLVGVALLVAFFLRKRFQTFADVTEFVGDWGLWAGFLLSLGSTLMSLFYSEILGLIPCGLCWMIRVFTYSQVVLFGTALLKKDKHIADYSIALSSFGLIIALYNHYLQMGGSEFIQCPAAGNVDCAQRFLFEFGYITFPLSGAIFFALLIIFMLFVRRKN